MSVAPESTLRVVLVEDDATVRLLVAEQLSGHDVDVIPVDPGRAEPLAVIARESPDAVILDWRMPGATGLELCRALRAAPHGDRLGIVFLTGLSDSRDRHLARHAGADAFLVKGASAAQVFSELRRVVHERRGERVDAPG